VVSRGPHKFKPEKLSLRRYKEHRGKARGKNSTEFARRRRSDGSACREDPISPNGALERKKTSSGVEEEAEGQ
jgi:hypothetical protein